MGEGQSSAAHAAVDMTRRMVCGGLAGMVAKVSLSFCNRKQFFFSFGIMQYPIYFDFKFPPDSNKSFGENQDAFSNG